MKKYSVFEFNHIDKLLSEEEIRDQFIDKMKVIDEMIIDQTPMADKYVKLYDKKHK